MSEKKHRGREDDSSVGRPSNPKKPSETQADKQADGDQRTSPSTGAGQESARGIHGANEGGSKKAPGSEPLKHRSEEHVSGYGGNKGAPKRSSDQR